ISSRAATRHLEELLNIHVGYMNDVIEVVNKKDETVFKDNERLALYSNYMYEKGFKEKLNEMASKPSYTVVDNVEEKLETLEKENGFKYTSEQGEAIKKAVDNNVLVINGKGGVGKTTILQGVVSVLDDYSYVSCALSGKAAKVLKDNGLK